MPLHTKILKFIVVSLLLLNSSLVCSCIYAYPDSKEEVMKRIQALQNTPTTPENVQDRSSEIKELLKFIEEKEGKATDEEIVGSELKQRFRNATLSKDYSTASKVADEIIGNLGEFAQATKQSGKVKTKDVSPTQESMLKPSVSDKQTPTKDEDSPFGIFVAFDLAFHQFRKDMGFSHQDYWNWTGRHFRSLGARWSRQNLLFIWGLVEPKLGKGYHWESSQNDESRADSILKAAYAQGGKGFNMVAVIEPSRQKRSLDIKGNEDHLKKFLRAVVSRYNADGINDYDPNIRVKYWQLTNELELNWFAKGGSVEGYVKLLSLFSKEIRSVDPEAKIILGAEIASRDQRLSSNLKAIISKLNGEKLFDVVDIHYWERATEYKMTIAKEMRSLLDKYGYHHVEIWSSEHGTYVNQPLALHRPKDILFQTEREQAISLIKRYVYNLAHDVDKIFWNNLVEWNGFGGNKGGLFDNLGLISDGRNSGEVISSLGTPRLSYYAYKNMTERLQGSDWDNIQIIQESQDIYVYKFTTHQGKRVWVAWSDHPKEREITISGIDSERVNIIRAIPAQKSGKEVGDYQTVFRPETKKVEQGRIDISLQDSPVFIE